MEKTSRIFMISGATVYIWIHGTGISLIVLLAALIFAIGLVMNLKKDRIIIGRLGGL